MLSIQLFVWRTAALCAQHLKRMHKRPVVHSRVSKLVCKHSRRAMMMLLIDPELVCVARLHKNVLQTHELRQCWIGLGVQSMFKVQPLLPNSQYKDSYCNAIIHSSALRPG